MTKAVHTHGPSMAPMHARVTGGVGRLHTPAKLPDDQVLHTCLLTYASDMSLLDATTLPHGRANHDLMMASLDHAMWFHQVPKADTWLLYKQSVESTSGARGLAIGKFFNHEGLLVASCMHEGLMRWDF